jgi:hypothetical protein
MQGQDRNRHGQNQIQCEGDWTAQVAAHKPDGGWLRRCIACLRKVLFNTRRNAFSREKRPAAVKAAGPGNVK